MKISHREIDRAAYSCDASVYRIVPSAVAWPENESDIIQLFKQAHQTKIPLTFRTGGTSLSGQAVTAGTLVDLSRHWRHAEVLNNGQRILVKPGIVGAHVNDYLKPFSRKIGPDPASISAAMMGGILANNSSGMCCGTEQNSYQTLARLRVIFPDGTIVDTNAPNANELLLATNPRIYAGILDLREKVLNNSALVQKIKRKYRYKNTTGYGLNSFIDFDNPVDIISHLMIGSEGTLGFISEAELTTVPLNPYAITGLLFFNNPVEACQATLALKESGAGAIELMDRAALRSVENQKGCPSVLANLSAEATALLVEYQASSLAELERYEKAAHAVAKNLSLEAQLTYTSDPEMQSILWKIRKGTFPAVGAARIKGTAVLIEDVLFPLEEMANGVRALQNLFQKFEYCDANIFGHAKDGNLHFVLSQSFASQTEIERYNSFMTEVVNLVAVQCGGALKAEHGTGRNMAPFVVQEWGTDGLDVMKELKSLLDPHHILNPDVVVSDNPNIHLAHLKNLPQVHPEVDTCIECGYCEPICPSEKLTLTPRKRIIVSRELKRLENESNKRSHARRIAKQFQYAGIDTCAADGLCALQCPVNINTGTFIKNLRAQKTNRMQKFLAHALAEKFGKVECFARALLRSGHLVAKFTSHGTLQFLTSTFLKIHWNEFVPQAQTLKKIGGTNNSKIDVVLFPTCVNRVMGNIHGEPVLTRTALFADLCNKAGLHLSIPTKSPGQCCGMPFFSKGFFNEGTQKLEALVDAMWDWTCEGKLPLVVDNSPCTHTILEYSKKISSAHMQKFQAIKILDVIEFTHDFLLDKLSISPVPETAHIYPVCSVTKMNLTPKLKAIAQKCAQETCFPERPACCGQAGDRGFSYPELTASAVQKIEWNTSCQCQHPSKFYSTSRTCEIALSKDAQRAYSSILELVHKACSQTR